MVKLSLILPIYNVEKFLPDCLDSLFAQDISEDEYEVICVIDGSPDNSKDVVLHYMKNHSNIVLIEQKNSGVCAARNHGFKKASGKYVWFIDPDDMIAAKCFGTILQMMEDSEADIFEMDYTTCDEEEHFKEDEVEFKIDGKNREGSSGSGWLSVCLSDYLRKNNITFNEQLSYGEDYLWAFQTKYRRHKSIYTNEKLYLYRQRNNSAMHIVSYEKTEKHIKDMLLLYDIYGREYDRCQIENMPRHILKNIRQRRQLCQESALFYLMQLKLSPKDIKTKLKTLRTEGYYPYKLMFWNLGITSSVAPFRNRVFTFLFPFEPYYLFACSLWRRIGK